jgi:orotidine-5'-phosphate decarboxylase
VNMTERLLEQSRRCNSVLCVGLDPVWDKLPEAVRQLSAPILAFNQRIVEATAAWACAFKPNIAFYEALGPAGLETLRQTIAFVHERTTALVIVDAKRGDIGNTSAAYAQTLYDTLQADAVTLNPYLGRDALAPFLDRPDRGALILCRTSNPGAGEFQDLLVDGRPLYQVVAERVRAWNELGNCGLVVGATFPEELAAVRALCPDMPLLIPGVGAQQGDLAAAVQAGVDQHGGRILVNVARGILYASTGPDFAAAASRAAEEYCRAINKARAAT